MFILSLCSILQFQDGEVPEALLINVAYFCDHGGLSAIREAFQDADPTTLPFPIAHHLINIVTQVKLIAYPVFPSKINAWPCVHRHSGLLISGLDPRSRGLGSRPGRVNVLCSWAKHRNWAASLSTQEYKWVLENHYRNLMKCWG